MQVRIVRLAACVAWLASCGTARRGSVPDAGARGAVGRDGGEERRATEDAEAPGHVAAPEGTRSLPDGGPTREAGWTPGRGPGPACSLPPLLCNGPAAYCGEIVLFTPASGPGYDDIPLDDETLEDQSASYLRRDLMMTVRYAAAKVACKSAAWRGGNHAPVALGDMGEKDGSCPGTAKGAPAHPPGTHMAGSDIDIAYYQLGDDNHVRPICGQSDDPTMVPHCTQSPDRLDPWRTALFIGYLFEQPQLRVVGVDGRAGPLIESSLIRLCDDGWVPKDACARVTLAWEETDTGMGWYLFHASHMHVSIRIFEDE